jgi:hypothetical protein
VVPVRERENEAKFRVKFERRRVTKIYNIANIFIEIYNREVYLSKYA